MASQKLQECQRNADEVKVLMKDNVEKIFEREGKLENLEVRATELKEKACNFQKTARTVERKTRWEKWRWYIISAIVVFVLLFIIIAIILSQVSWSEAPSSSSSSSTTAIEDGN
ncbi:vesicle-associated membrane protein 5-like isoform X1 [Hyla sarda]|uniref:vesicle-associated membrane protein 5-like isoform X1 n=1 Tax=Hyla sarda TaxID=327740 RepID=UPI0024C2F4DA|nr:vesicle-associated membrane protein 5-like isoform X1 [Hyla sarda]